MELGIMLPLRESVATVSAVVSGASCQPLPGSSSGWQQGSSQGSQLIYTLQVSPCGSGGPPACPPLTLYR